MRSRCGRALLGLLVVHVAQGGARTQLTSRDPALAQPLPPQSDPISWLAGRCAGGVCRVTSAAELRRLVASQPTGGQLMEVALPEGARFNLSGLPLNVSGDVELTISSEGIGATLDAGDASRALEVGGGARLTLRRVHMTGGRAHSSGGCVYVHFGSDAGAYSYDTAEGPEGAGATRLTLDGCAIELCTASRAGGGILVQGGVVDASNTTFANCTAGNNGGGLAVQEGVVTMVDGALTNCAVTGVDVSQPGIAYGGGVYVGNGNVTLASMNISGASASASGDNGQAYGGGVYVQGGNVTLVSTNVSGASASASGGNGAAAGGGVFVGNGNVTLASMNISGASASASGDNGEAVGGGMYVGNGNVTLTSTTVSGASASASGGKGVTNGGGVYVQGGNVTLTSTTVSGASASASASGDGTWAGDQGSAGGGGMYVENGNVTLTSTTISGGSASASGDNGRANGGGMYVENGNVTLTSTTVSGGSASASGDNGQAYGGGMYVGNGNVTLTSTTISGGSADHGGGLHVSCGWVLLTNETALLGNRAASGGTFYGRGGTTLYRLAAPAGRWIEGAVCRVNRAACPTIIVQDTAIADPLCTAIALPCMLNTDPTAMIDGISCPAMLLVQPCDWRTSPELIGSIIQILPTGAQLAIEIDYPYLCSGSVGSLPGDGANPTLQSSPQCAGVCPPGSYCDGGRTPNPCGVGSYCPAGAARPTPCPERFSTTLGPNATAPDECVCAAGHFAASALRCVACPLHTNCSRPAATRRTLLVRPGAWRPGYNSTDVKPCHDPSACVGGRTEGTAVFDPRSTATCAAGRSGVYCTQCEAPHAFPDSAAGCQGCGAALAPAFALLGCAALLARPLGRYASTQACAHAHARKHMHRCS